MTGTHARNIKGLGIPNILSILRLILIPFFVWAFFSGIPHSGPISAAILIFSGLTDIADGFIARRFQMITTLGQILDPLADKLTQATVCVCLVIRNPALVWLLILYVLKESLMLIGGLRIIAKHKKIDSSKWFGKLSTVVFYTVFISIICFDPGPVVTDVLLAVALCFMVFAFIMYIPVFRRLIKNVSQPQKTENDQDYGQSGK